MYNVFLWYCINDFFCVIDSNVKKKIIKCMDCKIFNVIKISENS